MNKHRAVGLSSARTGQGKLSPNGESMVCLHVPHADVSHVSHTHAPVHAIPLPMPHVHNLRSAGESSVNYPCPVHSCLLHPSAQLPTSHLVHAPHCYVCSAAAAAYVHSPCPDAHFTTSLPSLTCKAINPFASCCCQSSQFPVPMCSCLFPCAQLLVLPKCTAPCRYPCAQNLVASLRHRLAASCTQPPCCCLCCLLLAAT